MSEENFDAVDWINKTLKKSDDQQNKEVIFLHGTNSIRMVCIMLWHLFQVVVSSLVSKLQLYVQQVNVALEETSQNVLASMPRIMTDAQVS